MREDAFMDGATLQQLLRTQPDAPPRGRGINGVRTTGIYCRDGCSARPLAQNVTRYASAIAAEAAGFRPCLRCRPDRLPPTTIASAEGVVERALMLISDGALDHETEETLAARLGVTARHLRRLFQQHVGATPALVARSRRAHFARRLLDETDLRVEEIAEASGFASVRQLNRVMRETFRFTPSELRARRLKADRLIADGGIRLRVPYDGALAFEAMLAYMAPRAIPGVEVVEGGTYRRTTSTHGEPGVIEVTQAEDGRHLLVVAHLPSWRTLIDDVARIRRLFGLDSPAAESTALAEDAGLAALIEARPGMRVPKSWDPFETAVRILLGQQVTVSGATTLAGRLVEAFGQPVDGLAPLGLTHLFPSALRLAETPIEGLRSIGVTEARARSIRDFARGYVTGAIRLDAALPLEEASRALEALPGIGPWTAQMVALRAIGYRDAFPSGDLGIRRGASRLAGAEGLLDAPTVEAMAEAWRPHRALAALHLWLGSSGG